MFSIDLHNCADSEGRGSAYDRSFARNESRPISSRYLELIVKLINKGWWVAFLSYIGLDSHALRRDAQEKVAEFSRRLAALAYDLPVVKRQLPLKLVITGSKIHWKHGKPQQHIDLARRLGVRCGVHVDDCQEVADAFASKFRDEERIFRVRYHPGSHYIGSGARQFPLVAFPSAIAAIEEALKITDIPALCETNPVSHRGW